MDKINVALIGFGRIGQIHYNNILSSVQGINVKVIADPYIDEHSTKHGFLPEKTALLSNWQDIFSYNIDALLIAAPTALHPEIIKAGLYNNKHIFCEKPVAINIETLEDIANKAQGSEKILQIGFNRRFDNDVMALKARLGSFSNKDIHTIKITSRDPKLPDENYIKHSGGIYHDMIIHDFDMACHLMDKKVKSIYSTASVLLDSNLKKYNDYDTAITTLVFCDDSMAVIDNSRQAVYGYDQRIEIYTKDCKIAMLNQQENNLIIHSQEMISQSKIKYFFLERYNQSYINELNNFQECIKHNNKPTIGISDVINAVTLANAAKLSNKEKKSITI